MDSAAINDFPLYSIIFQLFFFPNLGLGFEEAVSPTSEENEFNNRMDLKKMCIVLNVIKGEEWNISHVFES